MNNFLNYAATRRYGVAVEVVPVYRDATGNDQYYSILIDGQECGTATDKKTAHSDSFIHECYKAFKEQIG